MHYSKKEEHVTHTWAILLVLFCTLITASAQLLWKTGMNQFKPDVHSLLTNIPLLSGFVLYGIGAALLIIALRGGELSVLYPFIATSFVWVALLSSAYLHESITLFKWGGIIFIIAGIGLIGKGSR